jgi:hypothetical protein
MTSTRLALQRQRLVALLLGAAAIVLVMAPALVGDPNPLAFPAAMVVAAAAAVGVMGGIRARRFVLAVAVGGAALSALWLWGASNGFGKGVPWWDDLAEAGILVAIFLAASLFLAQSMRAPVR